MGKTYRQMQRVVKEYRKKHPEFWCKVNVSYEELIKIHKRIPQSQQKCVDTEKTVLMEESKLTQINIPVVQAQRILVPGASFV